MENVLSTLQSLFTLTFVVTSMLSMGLSLTVSQILQPLRNTRLVIMALAANFVIVPAVAFALSRIIPLDQSVQIGLLLLGTAAGAPFLPKLAQIAKANVAFSVGLMTILIIVTIVYLPIVLPLLLPGVEVDAGKIALTLIVTMLVPLLIGLVIKARYEGVAGELEPVMAQISTISLVLLLVLMLGLNITNVIDLFGTGAILATVLFIVISIAAGYLLGGPSTDTKQVLALGQWPAQLVCCLHHRDGQLRRPAQRVGLPRSGWAGGNGHLVPDSGRVRQAQQGGHPRIG